MSNRALVYMWRAEYQDGTHLCQYDEETFKANKFTDINQNNISKFVMYPFSSYMENGLNSNRVKVKSIPFLPVYTLNLDKNKRLIYYRDNFISHEDYHRCSQCNKEFKFNLKSIFKSKYPSPICPHCGAHDYFYCNKCGIKYSFEDSNRGLCPTCKGHLNQIKLTSRGYSREKRWIEYILGWQITVNGRNVKSLLRVSETGDAIII